MKHLFNDISKQEKQRILEMHGVHKKIIKEQIKCPDGFKPIPEFTFNSYNGKSDGPEVIKNGGSYCMKIVDSDENEKSSEI